MGRKGLLGFVRVSPPLGDKSWSPVRGGPTPVGLARVGNRADTAVMAEEITNSMRNCGVTKIEDLRPEMVGPAGPWVGQNMPPWKK